ncbi:hypothetical protein, partial [Salmonella enterica]|uniref:hypothetical protein n=1 Tax=Salmonella enterica TaxID=28901 RepID=UPI003F4B863B
EYAYVTQARVFPLTRPVFEGWGSVGHMVSGTLPFHSVGGVGFGRAHPPSTIQNFAGSHVNRYSL